VTVALAILAGGRGVRLGGVAKGLLRQGGRTLIESQLGFGAHFDERLIVTGDAVPYLPFARAHRARIVGDLRPGLGAPGGLHAALCQSRCDWVVAVACDMPFLSWPPLARLLEERAEDMDAAAFEVGGWLQPFPSLWRREAAPLLTARLERQPALRELLTSLRLRRLDQAALAAVDPDLRAVRSVNRPEELTAAGLARPAEP
jgi:molybdopterin-guanine dinucleotide biosynthesis protein A